MLGNFETDRHALYCGWVMGVAKRHGLPFEAVMEDGNWTPKLALRVSDDVAITLVIPPPPDEWELVPDQDPRRSDAHP